ncbi:MAG: hypothetical protein FJ265_06060 [Planctomycetes bacterium]|nr:hypothetical protein [Planctomycetota bacterium]
MTKTLHSMLAATAIVLGGWWALAPWRAEVLRAGLEDTVLGDSDQDFLPDVVEWAVLTNAANPDTDGDQCPDFVEVVQRGSPRQPGVVRALDHEMRVVVTAPPEGSPDPEPTFLHLLFRFVGRASLMTSFQVWAELPSLPGLQVPLDLLGCAPIHFAERATPTDGLWIRISVPMVSEQMLRTILPCSIQARAIIGGRCIRAGASLFDLQGVICALVPYIGSSNSGETVALQPIGRLSNVLTPGTNKICLLELQRVGVGSGGAVYEVVDAACEDCNELECGVACPLSRGWIISIPGGLEAITGG